MIYRIVRAILKAVLTPLFRFEAKGLEEVPPEGPAVIASNHKSWLDPVAIGIVLKRPVSFMAKAELFRYPIFGWLIRNLYAFPVKRGEADISALKNALRILKEGRVLGIFVEGTRIKAEGIGELRKGIYAISKSSGAPVIACAIKGTRPLFRSKFFPLPGKVKLKFELFRADARVLGEEEYLKALREKLERMYNEL